MVFTTSTVSRTLPDTPVADSNDEHDMARLSIRLAVTYRLYGLSEHYAMKWFYWSNVDSADWVTCVMWVVAEGGDVGCEC